MKKGLSLFSCISKRRNSSDDAEQNNRNADEFALYLPIVNSHTERKKSSNVFQSFRRRFFQKEPRGTSHSIPKPKHIWELPCDSYVANSRLHEEENLKWNNWKHTGDVTDANHSCRICKRRSRPERTWEHAWPRDDIVAALASSPFSLLPNEIYFRIFQSLPVRDLASVSLVCRQFKIIADDDMIWQSKCRSKSNISKKLLSKSYKEIYMDWMYETFLRSHQLGLFQKDFGYDDGGYLPICAIFYATASSSPSRLVQANLCSTISAFKQHPNEVQRMAIQLSVHLEKTMPELLILFPKISDYFHSYSSQTATAVVKQMILRYYRFLQLKVHYPPNILLIPTLDIEVIWQTHLARPQTYRDDCLRLFGRVIDHTLLLDEIEQFLKEKAFLDTCRLYEEHFKEKYCALPLDIHIREKVPKYERSSRSECSLISESYSYWDETYFEWNENLPEEYQNPFAFDEGDVIRNNQWFYSYKTFMANDTQTKQFSEGNNQLGSWQMTLMKKSYERFLYLAAKYPADLPENDFLSPTYAVDFVGRCHQQEPVKYSADCQKFLGYLLDYSSRTKRAAKMNEIWKFEFNCNFDLDHLCPTYDNHLNTSHESIYF